MPDETDATIVYEQGEETIEETVANKHLVYFQDHWVMRAGEDDNGVRVKRIPRERVQYVERSVSEFSEEFTTLKNRAESLADDLRDRLLGDGVNATRETSDEPTRIDVDDK